MDIKRLSFLITVPMVIFSGCANGRNEGVQPIRSSLGRETCQPPQQASVAPSGIPELAEPNGVVTLRDTLALALARNPQLGIFPYDLRAADARVLQAGLRPNPELQIGIEEFGGRGERNGFDGAETTVQVGQPIELGGKRARRKRVASLDKELVQWDYKAARLDVMRETTLAFVAVLAAQERLALTERLLELSRRAQAAVAQRVKAGKDSPVDELRANVAFSESQIERQKAEKALIAAMHGLAAAWGGHTPVFEKAADDFYEVSGPRPLTEMTAAIAGNPDLGRWATEQDRRRAALRLEKAQAAPDITVGGGVRRFEQTDDAAMVFGFAMPIPILNRNQGGILAAMAELAKARQQYEAARIATLAALSQATSAMEAAYDEVTISRNDVLPKARQAFEAAQQGYEQGKFDYLYVLDAQRTLFRTQAQYVDSVEAYHKAQADVERLIGGPLNTEDKNMQGISEAKLTGDEK
jgi:cobalt-zinc-cadmium efflux system outer membrane protein